MTAPAPGALSAQLSRLRQRLLARPLTTSLGLALFVLALRRLLSQLRRRLLSTGMQRTTTGGLPPPCFVLDAKEDFHAFVFSNDGICIAHGRDPSFVGKSLRQVFANEEIEDSAEMHERFLRAAAAGGGWCAYSWRTSPAVLRLKGAYIFGVDLGGGQHGYAGVGYALCPPASAGRALGLYGFVCNGEGRFVAHGGSAEFIGATLAEVVERTNNHLTDPAALLARFATAARLGGGYVDYPWRNAPEAPLLTKGAFLMRVELGGGCTRAAAAIAKGSGWKGSGSFTNLAALAQAAEREATERKGEPVSATGVTMKSSSPTTLFGGDRARGGDNQRTLFCGVGYFGGNEAEAEESSAGAAAAAAAAATGSEAAGTAGTAGAGSEDSPPVTWL